MAQLRPVGWRHWRRRCSGGNNIKLLQQFERHEGELFALLLVCFVLFAHVLADLEAKFVLPEAALAGVTALFYQLLQVEREGEFKLAGFENYREELVDTPMRVIALGLFANVVLYMGMLVLAINMPEGTAGQVIVFPIMAVSLFAGLCIPWAIGEGRFVHPGEEDA